MQKKKDEDEVHTISLSNPKGGGRVTLTLREHGAKKVAKGYISCAQAARILTMIAHEAQVAEQFYGKVPE